MDDSDTEDLIREQFEKRDISYTSVSVTHNELYVRSPEESEAAEIGAIVRRLLDPASLKRIKIASETSSGVDHRVIEDWNG